MGQYQQWLFAQEVDRHLKTERETLETELLYLQDRITIMEQTVPEAENLILQALEEYFQAQTDERGQEEIRPAWSNLPQLETPHTWAGERSSIPGMQRNGEQLAFAAENEHVVDEETRRLNEDIRRWFIRWRRQLAATERPEEVQNE